MICFNALNAGDLDLYAEYTGTGLVNILKEQVMSDPGKVYEKVKKAFKENYNLVWLKPFGFNNTYTLTMRKKQAERLGIKTISDLAEYLKDEGQKEAGHLKAGFNAEFIERPDGFSGLADAYDMEFERAPLQMDSGLMYKACADGDVDVVCAFATDGRIAAYELVTLEDDKGFFPPYYAAPLVRAQVLARYPKLSKKLNVLAGRIDNETMRGLNFEVDRKDGPKSAREAARDFLIFEELIDKESRSK
jgi:osmoprotectant transport system permease protein